MSNKEICDSDGAKAREHFAHTFLIVYLDPAYYWFFEVLKRWISPTSIFHQESLMADNIESGGAASKPEVYEGSNGSSLKMHPELNLAVLCDSNSCIPFSTKNSGDSNSGAFVQDNFSTLDSNRDGNLGKKELSEWAERFPDGSPADEMTDLVIKSFDDVASLAQDDGNGISQKDLEALGRLQRTDPKELSKEEAQLLKKLDVDTQKKEAEEAKARNKEGSATPKTGAFFKFADIELKLE